MKYFGLVLATLFTVFASHAQTEEDPVFWSHEVIELEDGQYEMIFKGQIMEGWHVYSQYTAEGGSLPSIFTYDNAGQDYELLGQTEEGPTIKEFSEIFEVEETFFKKEAVFKQKIKLLNPDVKQEIEKDNLSIYIRIATEAQ